MKELLKFEPGLGFAAWEWKSQKAARFDKNVIIVEENQQELIEWEKRLNEFHRTLKFRPAEYWLKEIEERKIRVKEKLEQKKILMEKQTKAEQRKLAARKRRKIKNEKLVEKMKKELCKSGYCFITPSASDFLNNTYDLKKLTKEIRDTHKGLKQSFYVTKESITRKNSDVSICFILNDGYVLHNAVKYY
jgi:antirestriction protein